VYWGKLGKVFVSYNQLQPFSTVSLSHHLRTVRPKSLTSSFCLRLGLDLARTLPLGPATLHQSVLLRHHRVLICPIQQLIGGIEEPQQGSHVSTTTGTR
jgi:hypothetical protein